jgi:hypothetical protein
MTDESGLSTKTDVLDFVISFIVEHEKRMDQMVERLERASEKLSRSSGRTTATLPPDTAKHQPNLFTMTINNPEDYDRLKSVKIDWESGHREFTPEISEIDSILDKIDFRFRDDR